MSKPKGETDHCRHRLLRYCQGQGLDLGCGMVKIKPEAIGIDLHSPLADMRKDARKLDYYPDEHFDFVYSSHLLEEIQDTEPTLKEWLRVIKPGGYLVLYQVDRDLYYPLGDQRCNPAHKHHYKWEELWKILEGLGTSLQISGTHPESNEWSFEIVVRKAGGEAPPAADTMENISILVPTLNRPKGLTDFAMSVDAMTKDKKAVEILFGIHGDDPASAKAIEELKAKVGITVRGEVIARHPDGKVHLAHLWNQLYERASFPILGYFGDDVIFRTNGWDEEVRKEFAQDKSVMVSCNDVHVQRGKQATLYFTHRSVHEKVGFYLKPEYRRWYMDTFWDRVYTNAGKMRYRQDIVTEHFHPDCFPERLDDTYKKMDNLKDDDRVLWMSEANRQDVARCINLLIQAPAPEASPVPKPKKESSGEPIHFCTLSDANFILKGLALIQSLEVTCSNYTLDYLCLDIESYDILHRENNPHVNAMLLQTLEEENPELVTARANRPYNEYCWTLASFYTRYMLPKYSELTYIDSDLYFYGDPQCIIDEIGDKIVGIIRHRHNEVGHNDGAYNVGVVYFKANETGKACLDWWADAVLNKKHPELSTCGDQKYLEDFVPRFGEENICIADKTFGHGAPWNYRLYDWSTLESAQTIGWDGGQQPFVFNHFSRFSCNFATDEISFTSGQYMDHTLRGRVFETPQVRQLYFDYYRILKAIKASIESKASAVAKVTGEAAMPLEGPAVAAPLPKISFGMIVLNGDYVLKECLESVYPIAHQILVAEGPVKFWQEKGLKTSDDKTNDIINNFPDPKGILRISHGQYAEKDEQVNAYMSMRDPNADYLWNLDSDEVLKPEDLEQLQKILHDHKYTSVGIRSCSFYGGFERNISGFEEAKDQFLRGFKVYPGSTWKTHRPPTIMHTQQNILAPKHLDSETLWEKWGIRMYHYSYVFPRQVKSKIDYYKEMVKNLSGQNKVTDDYFKRVYLPWVNGDEGKRQEIEKVFGGVHEWKKRFREDAFTVPFSGEHPAAIQNSMTELLAEFDKQLKAYQ